MTFPGETQIRNTLWSHIVYNNSLMRMGHSPAGGQRARAQAARLAHAEQEERLVSELRDFTPLSGHVG